MLTDEERAEIRAAVEASGTAESAGLEAMKAVQRRRGWVSDDLLREIADVLELPPAQLENVATFFSLVYRRPVGRHVLLICDSVSCYLMGYEILKAHLTARLGIDYGGTTPDGRFTLLPVACLGWCDHAPAMLVDQDVHVDLTPEKIDEILREVRMTEQPLTGAMRPDGEALTLAEYERADGYQGLRQALTTMAPAEVTAEVKAAQLLGRGGAGFPAGLKWAAVPSLEDDPGPRYVVANADEMEPGTFKDRWLLLGNPHQLLEGVILAAYAIRAENAFIFLRAEYREAQTRLERAIAEATAGGYLGRSILGSGLNLDLRVHVSAGRYMAGEADALLNVLEGRRAVPRSKPPHPTLTGLWGRPTVVNNVETFSNVPHIIRHGAQWFHGLSLSEESGTKIYGVSGKVKRPGLWELPLGTPVRVVLEECAGGMREGLRFRGLLPGGASTDFLVEQHLDVKLDFASVRAAGSRLGTGTMIVLDDRTCPVGMVHSLARFFARESCGWCTPCRDGLPWTEQTLLAIEEGRGQPGDLERLEADVELMKPGHTFCALAPGAMEPVQSALRYFREDFERHLREQRCPWR